MTQTLSTTALADGVTPSGCAQSDFNQTIYWFDLHKNDWKGRYGENPMVAVLFGGGMCPTLPDVEAVDTKIRARIEAVFGLDPDLFSFRTAEDGSRWIRKATYIMPTTAVQTEWSAFDRHTSPAFIDR